MLYNIASILNCRIICRLYNDTTMALVADCRGLNKRCQGHRRPLSFYSLSSNGTRTLRTNGKHFDEHFL